MTTSSPRSPRLLLIATVVLAVAGGLLLVLPHRPGVSASPARPPAAAPSASPVSPSAGEDPAAGGAPATSTAAVAAATATVPVLPPHGEGVAGDRAVQQALEAAWPADLAADDERPLLRAGRELLRADATGTGRAAWPAFFGDPGRAVVPAFATARFRIQAVIARRDGAEDRAVVHLVWAGTDRGGTFTDGRITDLRFTRTHSTKGATPWTPRPRA